MSGLQPPERSRRDPASIEEKPVSDSSVVLAVQMELEHSNLAGNVHGGAIMRLVDNAAGLSAAKHAGGLAVTASMDDMSFIEPVFLGDVVTVKAMVNEAWTTSMEVGVRVEAENYRTGRRAHTSSAYLVFVALDDEGKPRPVPRAVAESDEQRQRQREAQLRREARLARKDAILAARAERGE